ncbi:putative DNA mismatch repair protein [Actinokineospora spheciospongiae]|uniref:Putative DNA mismatch repair protein n=1 Tax=Actinokineospora spheciospongiae TaxID=909613 RepID=W7IG50_9PSEU|nr:ATP-binding protein [Actinokineospora spheciospongiae]EWC59288.1 putative DNA mismatch repair protein [Actinokineospora spheciospongiae]
MPLQTGRDQLDDYAKARPLDALAELVWNALDAEATEIDVEIESASTGIGGGDLRIVRRISVSDNGHGMDHERAESAFKSLGDSWKKSLNGRTVNDKRALHGSQGKGRLYVYSLGYKATWSSVAQHGEGRQRVTVMADLARMAGFSISDPAPTSEPTGTLVSILVEEQRNLSALVRDDVAAQLTARLAGHLLANQDITVTLNGATLNPTVLMEGDPTEIVLTPEAAEASAQQTQPPTLVIVDWNDEMRTAPGLVLCNEDRMALIELDKTAPQSPVRSTGYLCWAGFSQSRIDLAVARMKYPELISEATHQYTEHVKARTGAVTAGIVDRLKNEQSYPFDQEVSTDPIQRTEREMFDLVVVSARRVLNAGSRQQRAMSARLLKLAMEERPEGLDKILAETLELSADDRDQLAEMLRYSSLGNIINAAAEVTQRLDLIATLRHFLYSTQASQRFREVDQLHPLVKDNLWLFGEDWRLSRSESSLTTVLRDALHEDALVEADLPSVQGADVERGNRRVDLVLQRTVRSPGGQDRLVVELKRPSVKLGIKELQQVQGYARTLSKHPGVGQTKWTFWLVGSSWDADELEDQLNQRDRAVGHVAAAPTYDIWVTTWGKLLDEAQRRLDFYREQLGYDISQDAAVAKVRARHGLLVPPAEQQQTDKK